MASKKQNGNDGEKEIVDLVPCPNCKKSLVVLPPNYPLYDLQCSGCSFRAQVKTNNSKPKKEVFGAGWLVMEKVLKAGFMIPPLFLNFKWLENDQEKQEIRFYPFIPKQNLKKRTANIKSQNRTWDMFNYIAMDTLPYFVVYKK